VTNKEFLQKAREIGPAVWLLTAYWAMSKVDGWLWFMVDHGEPQIDEDFATFFEVSVYTIERWRKRLVKAGVVEAKRSSSARIRQLQDELGMGFKGAYRIRVQRPRLAVVSVRTLEAHSEDPEEWVAPLATQTIQ
jgi:hypothetical protein